MNSRFPGMDPFLENHWRDVHARLIIYACDQLQGVLPEALFARVEERVILEDDRGTERSRYPDVRVVESGQQGRAMAVADVELAEPIVVPLEFLTETYLEIRDAETGNRLVTVLEFLSVANKTPGDGQDQFLQKQRECRQAGVNLVEIDLLRGGQRRLTAPAERIPRPARTTYQICVSRGKAAVVELYPIPLEARLPSIRVPLREQDEDVPLHIQALLDQAYHNGRYGQTIDYRATLDPPLNKGEARWAKDRLKKIRARGGTGRK